MGKAYIHVECSDNLKKLVKDAAKRRGKSIKETTIMLLNAWTKLKDNESNGILRLKQEK